MPEQERKDKGVADNPRYEGENVRTIVELRRAVSAKLDEVRAALVDDLDIPIGTYNVIMDLSEKLEKMLYCNTQFCILGNPLAYAYDFAEDMESLAWMSGDHQLTRMCHTVGRLIYNFVFRPKADEDE